MILYLKFQWSTLSLHQSIVQTDITINQPTSKLTSHLNSGQLSAFTLPLLLIAVGGTVTLHAYSDLWDHSQAAFFGGMVFLFCSKTPQRNCWSVQCWKLGHQFPYKYYTPATEPTFGSSKKVGCWTINNWQQWQEDRAIWWEADGSCHKKELIFAEHMRCFSCRICLEWKVIMSTCLIDGESMYSNCIWTNSEKRIDIVCMFVWQWGLQGKYLQYQTDWILGSQTKVSWGGI